MKKYNYSIVFKSRFTQSFRMLSFNTLETVSTNNKRTDLYAITDLQTQTAKIKPFIVELSCNLIHF